MAQLVDFVVGDHLNAHQLGEVGNVGLGGRQHGEARPGEGDLRGGSKLHDHIRVARLGAQR